MKVRRRLIAVLAVLCGVVGLAVAAVPVADAASGPIFTVMNTSESLPDGVYFRNTPHTADTSRITGLGVYKNERVQLQCYATGDAVGAFNDKLWYYVNNVTRPTVSGRANVGYLNAHYINDGKNANVVDAGVAKCGTAAPVNPTYNRSAAVNYALAHARDKQSSSTLCTWFVSSALWAGGFAKTSGWQAGTSSSVVVGDFVSYFRAHYSNSFTDITPNLTTNAVPAAQPGDVIVYDWNRDGTYDHMSFVVDIASGQYPEVSEMGQFDFLTHPEYQLFPPSSSYVKRGWTWSAMHNEWLQQEYPGMKAYLLHINGGYFVGTF